MQELVPMNKNKPKKRVRAKADFIKAQKSLDDIQRTIQPFIKPSDSKRVTTAGQWLEKSCLPEVLIKRD